MNFGKFSTTKKESLNAIDIPNLPNDSISDICFNTENTLLAISSWDGSVRIYSIISQQPNYSFKPTEPNITFNPLNLFTMNAPVLSITFVGNNLFAGLIDGSICNININTNNINIVQPHTMGVKCLKSFNNLYLISGSFDSTIKVFDLTLKEIHSHSTPAKIYAMDLSEDILVAGLSDKSVLILNLSNMKQDIVNTKFNYNIRSICLSKSRDYGYKIIVGSVEGKAEMLNISILNGIVSSNNSGFVFKCHRIDNKLYSVNKIAMLNESIIITGGADGSIVFVNKNSRFKIITEKYSNPITAMSLGPDGSTFVFAIGDDWSKGYSNEKIPIQLKYVELKNIKELN